MLLTRCSHGGIKISACSLVIQRARKSVRNSLLENSTSWLIMVGQVYMCDARVWCCPHKLTHCIQEFLCSKLNRKAIHSCADCRYGNGLKIQFRCKLKAIKNGIIQLMLFCCAATTVCPFPSLPFGSSNMDHLLAW